MLLAVSEVFSRATSLAECLPIVAQRLLKRAESDRITISLIDHAAGEVLVAADARSLATREVPLQGKRWPLHIWVSYEEIGKAGRQSSPSGPIRIFPVAGPAHGPPRCPELPGYPRVHRRPGHLDHPDHVPYSNPPRIRRDTPDLDDDRDPDPARIEAVTSLETSQRRERYEAMRRRINESLQVAGNLQDSYETIAGIFREIPDVDGISIMSWQPEEASIRRRGRVDCPADSLLAGRHDPRERRLPPAQGDRPRDRGAHALDRPARAPR